MSNIYFFPLFNPLCQTAIFFMWAQSVQTEWPCTCRFNKNAFPNVFSTIWGEQRTHTERDVTEGPTETEMRPAGLKHLHCFLFFFVSKYSSFNKTTFCFCCFFSLLNLSSYKSDSILSDVCMLLQSELVNLCISAGSFKTQKTKWRSMLIMDFDGKNEFLIAFFKRICHIVLTLHFIYLLFVPAQQWICLHSHLKHLHEWFQASSDLQRLEGPQQWSVCVCQSMCECLCVCHRPGQPYCRVVQSYLR